MLLLVEDEEEHRYWVEGVPQGSYLGPLLAAIQHSVRFGVLSVSNGLKNHYKTKPPALYFGGLPQGWKLDK